MKARQRPTISSTLGALAIAMSAIYGAGMIWYQASDVWIPRAILATGWLAFAGFCAIWFFRNANARAIAIYALPFVALSAWFIRIEPRNDRVWAPEMAHSLNYVRAGDEITISNVRNFDWTGPAAANERWETRRYALSALRSVDVASLYWKGQGIAHTYFSFVWADGETLSISVEIRKEAGEEYSPVGGFFKAYEIAILGGDERDFYGWRVHFPMEDIQLFRTRAKPAEAQKFLVDLLDMANGLSKAPAFYNTLTNNCTTEALLLTDALGAGRPADWRIMASGYLPDLLYEMKLLDTSRPIAELRALGHILPAARTAQRRGLTSTAYSAAIRADIPVIPAIGR